MLAAKMRRRCFVFGKRERCTFTLTLTLTIRVSEYIKLIWSNEKRHLVMTSVNAIDLSQHNNTHVSRWECETVKQRAREKETTRNVIVAWNKCWIKKKEKQVTNELSMAIDKAIEQLIDDISLVFMRGEREKRKEEKKRKKQVKKNNRKWAGLYHLRTQYFF